MTFASYQKGFFQYSLPMFGIFIVVAIAAGVLPI
jgi:CitMHS family citrate-Mg2+:H+ or citrate-Ca2+:H+ symporter